MVGSALVRALRDRSDCQLVLRSHDELDLLDAEHVAEFFANEEINTVYLAAAKAGGIAATYTTSLGLSSKLSAMANAPGELASS